MSRAQSLRLLRSLAHGGCGSVWIRQRYTFGIVKAAQARGDFHVLAERGRRLLLVQLGADVPAGLATLKAVTEQALV